MSPSFSHLLPAFLVPFLSLSYPTDTPLNLDSFPHSPYYNTGPLDACFVITCIAVMAILRDAIRLGILEPFARWKLSADLRRKIEPHSHRFANGNGTHNANGHISRISKRESDKMHRSVLRFAEQGWSALYYSVQWTLGFVRAPYFISISFQPDVVPVHSLSSTHANVQPYTSLVKLSSYTPCWFHQILLSHPNSLLPSPGINLERRSAPKGSCSDDDPPCHHDRPRRPQLFFQRHSRWLPNYGVNGFLRYFFASEQQIYVPLSVGFLIIGL